MTTLTKHNKYSHGLIEDDTVEILPNKHFDRHLVPVLWNFFTREMLLSRKRNIAVKVQGTLRNCALAQANVSLMGHYLMCSVTV